MTKIVFLFFEVLEVCIHFRSFCFIQFETVFSSKFQKLAVDMNLFSIKGLRKYFTKKIYKKVKLSFFKIFILLIFNLGQLNCLSFTGILVSSTFWLIDGVKGDFTLINKMSNKCCFSEGLFRIFCSKATLGRSYRRLYYSLHRIKEPIVKLINVFFHIS